jgi:hypothetical protein
LRKGDPVGEECFGDHQRRMETNPRLNLPRPETRPEEVCELESMCGRFHYPSIKHSCAFSRLVTVVGCICAAKVGIASSAAINVLSEILQVCMDAVGSIGDSPSSDIARDTRSCDGVTTRTFAELNRWSSTWEIGVSGSTPIDKSKRIS